MGLFDKLRGSPEKRAADAALAEIYKLMTDEAVQNSMYPSDLQQLMAKGGGIDQVLDASGEFGRSASNPVPVNGPLGELVYISNLALPGGVQVIGHRLGSLSQKDVYEVVALDGSRWDLLFFDLYHTRKSRKLPTGYVASDKAAQLFLATNYSVQGFPLGIYEALRECTERIIGVPLAPPQLRDESPLRAFARPASHVALLQSLGLEGRVSAG